MTKKTEKTLTAQGERIVIAIEGGQDLCVPPVTYRADTGIHGEAIVVAECGHASALYIVGEGYSADDSDVCPATEDGCWPDPPASLIDAVATRTYYVVLGPDGNIKRRNRQDNGEYDYQRDAEAYRQSLPDPDYFTVEAWTERRGK